MSQSLSKQVGVVYYRPNDEATAEDYFPFKTYHYKWCHIHSGANGIDKICCLSQSDFEKLIQAWNSNPDIWIYTKQ